jgi:hypothetical protein
MGSTKFWKTLFSVDRRVLYLILIVLVCWQVLKPIDAKNIVLPASADLYNYLSSLKKGDVVLIESDWTTSTQGESKGQFKALMRLLMRKGVHFVITSIDPQAPVIAGLVVEEVVKEEGIPYRQGVDWAMGGYFPNAENHVTSMVNNIRRELSPKGIMNAPFLRNINDLSELQGVILVTASSSINLWYERIRNKAPLMLMCTAVMAGENFPYYTSRQLEGLVIGAKGAYDFETLLSQEFPDPKYINFQAGRRYMSPLFFALMLLVVSVVLGNIAMLVLKKRGEA